MASDTRGDRRRHGHRHGRPPGPPIAVRPGRLRESTDELAAAIEAAATQIESTMPATLRSITFQIEDVPTPAELRAAREVCPLGRQKRGNPSTVVLYRKPIEARCADVESLKRLVRDTVAELVGALAGVAPARVVPGYGQ